MDGEGLVPGELDGLLKGWDEGRGRKPHVLYTVPSGQNPTGATQSEGRRREVYEVCRRHDVLIVEDEPYYYLQMGEVGGGKQPEGVEEFLEGLIPTYTSMDVDGRVVRMDSFSKVVVPGSRVGWITASQQLVERFVRHAEVANQGPSGFSQVILHKLLDDRWGHEGYLRWLMNLRVEYTKRRDAMAAACEKHLPKEVVSWKPPQAGMFVSGPPFLPIFVAESLTRNSNGSRSTTQNTPTRAPRASTRLRRRSSTAASGGACWSPAGAGSAPSRTSRCRGCTSGRPLPRPRLRI